MGHAQQAPRSPRPCCAMLLASAIAQALPTFSLVLARGDAQNNFNVPADHAHQHVQRRRVASSASRSRSARRASCGTSCSPPLRIRPARPIDIATEALTGATLVAGDRVNASGSVTTLVWSFAHFAPGESLVFEADVDPASGDPTVDARTVWFNNGAAPNAQIQVTLRLRRATSSFSLADAPSANSYTLGATAVPEPGVAHSGRSRARLARCAVRLPRAKLATHATPDPHRRPRRHHRPAHPRVARGSRRSRLRTLPEAERKNDDGAARNCSRPSSPCSVFRTTRRATSRPGTEGSARATPRREHAHIASRRAGATACPNSARPARRDPRGARASRIPAAIRPASRCCCGRSSTPVCVAADAPIASTPSPATRAAASR